MISWYSARALVIYSSCVPIVFAILNSFRRACWALPPFTNICSLSPDSLHLYIYLGNYFKLFSDLRYLQSLLVSSGIAIGTIAITVPISFMFAWCIHSLHNDTRNTVLTLVSLTVFIPFIVKMYAWMYLSQEYLYYVIHERLRDHLVTCLFCCHDCMPLSIVLISSDLSKIEQKVTDAASDLGAKTWVIIKYIALPNCKNSLTTATALTAIAAFGEFIIPDLLGSGSLHTVGSAVTSECYIFHDLPMSCAISIAMLLWSALPMCAYWYIRHNRTA